MPIENLTPWLLLAASIAAGLSGLLVKANQPHDIERKTSPAGNAASTHRSIACGLYALSAVMLVAAVFSWLHLRAVDLPLALSKRLDFGTTAAIAAAIIASAIANAQRRRRNQRKHDEHG